jgi:hypothetical protein
MTSNNIGSTFRRYFKIVNISLFVMVFIAGCSSTKITSGQILVNKKLPRPGTIWVYDFVAGPTDMQQDASITEKINDPSNKPLTSKEIQLARQLGKKISEQLVEQINDMGLNAELAISSSMPQINDIVLRGYLYSVEPGNAGKRIFIGFGYGASVLDTLIEGYQMTPDGLRKLSSANMEAAGGTMPGGAVTSIPAFLILGNPIALVIGPAIKGVQEITGGPTIEGRTTNTASKIADKLKVRFQEEGWIKQNAD